MVVYKNKYLLMQDSQTTDELGNSFPDLATFPIEKFINNLKPAFYTLSYNDTQRFFDLINGVYQNFDFYDDITLWLNDIDYISKTSENFDKKISFYKKSDLDQFFFDNYVS